MNCDCPTCATWRQLYWDHPLDRRRTLSYVGLFLIAALIILAASNLVPSVDQVLRW